MARVLIAATPLYGHVRPLLQIGQALSRRGHRVALLTGSSYQAGVQAAGVDFRALPVDVDLSGPAAPVSHRRGRPRWIQGRDAILTAFIRPLGRQAEALQQALADGIDGAAFDVIIGDVAFLGVQPLLLGGEYGSRPPVIGISATPLSITSVDCAPFGTALRPWGGGFGRMRNRQIDWLLRHGPLRPVQRELDQALAPFGIPPNRADFCDAALAFDHVFHLGLEELEYPRRELPERVEFVGPLPADRDHQRSELGWLQSFGQGGPIIHVTQGTLANSDYRRLIIPTVRALADEDVHVVVSTGGRPVEGLRSLIDPWPVNACITEFVDYSELLPRTSIMITNGGYGGVQLAARYGVPMIIAGDSEDKPEVAARVDWAGLGIDLRTGRPRPGQLRRAVRTIRTSDRFRARADELQRAAEALPDPLQRISCHVEQLVPGGPGHLPSQHPIGDRTRA